MAAGGMTPAAVLEATTRSAAQLLGVDGELGTIEPGKRADLVVLEGDPVRLRRDARAHRPGLAGRRAGRLRRPPRGRSARAAARLCATIRAWRSPSRPPPPTSTRHGAGARRDRPPSSSGRPRSCRVARPGRRSSRRRIRRISRAAAGSTSGTSTATTTATSSGNYTSLILGHAHPAVVDAVETQVRKGSAFGAPSELEIALAEELVRRIDSVERVRFTNSGTEATMFAIRAARAVHRPVPRRDLRAGLPRDPRHGRRDVAGRARRGRRPRDHPALGRPRRRRPGARADSEDELAAIVIEPIQGAGGVRAASPELLRHLRAICDRHRRAADLRRGDLVPGRARRRPVPRRRPAGPDDPRQDHRRRVSARGVRRIGGDPRPLRRPAARRADPRRHVQREPGRRGGRPRDARAS